MKLADMGLRSAGCCPSSQTAPASCKPAFIFFQVWRAERVTCAEQGVASLELDVVLNENMHLYYS